jgi:hypothetical protein
MNYEHVPEGEYLFTDVTLDDTNLQPNPESGLMHVVGRGAEGGGSAG